MTCVDRILVGMMLSAGAAAPALAEEQPAAPDADVTVRVSPSEHQWQGEVAGAQAQHYRERAELFRRMGASPYKLGLIRAAEWQAARYQVEEAAWLAPVFGEPQSWRTPEAEHYARLARQSRAMGGSAYRTGQVDWYELQARRHGDQQPGWSPVGVGARDPRWWKPWLNRSL